MTQLADAARDELLCARRWRGPYREGCERLRLEDLAVPGATSETLIDEQTAMLYRLLIRRNRDLDRGNDVELVTIHIGGNDIAQPLQEACINENGDGSLPRGLPNWPTTPASSRRSSLPCDTPEGRRRDGQLFVGRSAVLLGGEPWIVKAVVVRALGVNILDSAALR